jgi:hypothetical protein
MTDRGAYPTFPGGSFDADYWRRRVRMTLEKTPKADDAQKQRLLRVAKEYERMAERAEAMRAGRSD